MTFRNRTKLDTLIWLSREIRLDSGKQLELIHVSQDHMFNRGEPIQSNWLIFGEKCQSMLRGAGEKGKCAMAARIRWGS